MDTKQREDWLKELRLSEQEILRQSLEEKNRRIRDLESEVRYLKDLIRHPVAMPKPQYAPARRTDPVPRRWHAR